jgi:hypothetical protein
MSALYPTTLQRCGKFSLHDRVVTEAGECGQIETISYRFIIARLDRGGVWLGDPQQFRHEERAA